MSGLAWLVGGGALATYWWSRTSPKTTSSQPPPVVKAPPPGQWVWPVAAWKGRSPVVSDGFHSPRPGVARHGGVDIMFKRLPADSFKAGTPNASKAFVMPDGHPVLAASDGVVWSAMPTTRGYAVVIDHGPRKLATFYTHLDKMLVAPTARGATKQRVRAGEPIGTVGFSPLDGEKLKHLHFELWLGGPGKSADPESLMRSWEVVADPRESLVARNGASYRLIGERGEAYPQWIRDLKDRAGVYIIRDADSHETLYVGSSTGQLYDTLTRHFQIWRRWKGFWKGQFAEGHDPGLTYDRGSVEVAVRLTRPDRALDEEARLIQRLRPRDNLLGQPADVAEEEVPF
ncbi:MAG: peptidoglycan DD-metalloendopeptidase family protein [Kofleriaceae bacterium]